MGKHDSRRREPFSAARYGIRLASVGIKDVILPGEMKEILNRVVEGEKVDKLTVFGGLDGVLKDVVRIQVPAN